MTDKPARKASKAEFHKMDPQLLAPDGKAKSWITRGGNFAIVVSEVEAEAVLEREDNPEEYMVLLPQDGASAVIEAGGGKIDAGTDSLTIIPPGSSRITAKSKGIIVRVFSKASEDVMALAWNADHYADGAPELAPPNLWPEPPDGFKIRHYPVAQYADANGPRTQPRLFRCTNLMVNMFVHHKVRRDTTELSPHWHDDFEQASLNLHGRWIHYLRYNWGPDLSTWREDDHGELEPPSVTIIPANVVHTGRDLGEEESSMYDIFCPPRIDFARKKGFIINEDEYPLPDIPEDDETKTRGSLQSWQKPG